MNFFFFLESKCKLICIVDTYTGLSFYLAFECRSSFRLTTSRNWFSSLWNKLVEPNSDPSRSSVSSSKQMATASFLFFSSFWVNVSVRCQTMFVVFKSALEKIDFILKGTSIFFFFYLTNNIVAGVLLHIMFMLLFLEPLEKTNYQPWIMQHCHCFQVLHGQFCLSVLIKN